MTAPPAASIFCRADAETACALTRSAILFVFGAMLLALATDRMERLRGYQLLHPELVTEGMNRLAQALICLTARGRLLSNEAFGRFLSDGYPNEVQTNRTAP